MSSAMGSQSAPTTLVGAAAGAEMGEYEVISDTRTMEASLRLLRVGPGKGVRPHYHTRVTQVYIILTGAAQVRLGDGRLNVHPFDAVRIPARTAHALSASEPSLVLSISVPPLLPDDQHPVGGPGGSPSEPAYGSE